MNWQVIGEKKQKIRSILTESFNKFLPQVEDIYTSKVPYSGIIITSDSKLTGKVVESSCYKKGGFVFLYKSYEQSYVDNGFKSLVDNIERLSFIYANEINLNPKHIELESCWAVSQEEGDYGTIHNHKSYSNNENLYSGMIYLKVPNNINPSTFPDGCLHFIINESVMYYPPIVNSVVIWPAEILHGIHPFKGENKRIGIAFNVIIN